MQWPKKGLNGLPGGGEKEGGRGEKGGERGERGRGKEKGQEEAGMPKTQGREFKSGLGHTDQMVLVMFGLIS